MATAKRPRRALWQKNMRQASDEGSIKVDPKGIRIRGAWICEELNLDGLPSDTKIGLRLTKCRLDRPLRLCDGGLPWLELDTCVLPAIVADRAQVGNVTVRGCRVDGDCQRERLSLTRAHLTGDLALDNTRFHAVPQRSGGQHPEPLATVQLLGVRLDGRLSMRGAMVRSSPDRGAGAAVCLLGATVAGSLELSGAE
ncbi:MAG: hypothetical protein JO168_17070 [Solirubrobacterales bacterium]|nr:hypothetical protein [Solirubrobacterales bacterium]